MAPSAKQIRSELARVKAGNDLAQERLRAKSLAMRGKALKKLEQSGKAFVPSMSAKYDAATRTRLRPGPRSTGGSADKHLSASVRGNLRKDCQDLERNSTIARIVIRRAQQLIVGDGPIVTSATGVKEWDDECDRLWNLYADANDPELVGHPDLAQKLSLAEILSGIVSSWCTDGDQLIIKTNRGSLQVIESERLVTPGSPYGNIIKSLPNGGRITDGVETDAAGVPVRYHVAPWTMQGMLDYSKTQPVGVANADLICNPIGVKAGLTRGEPALQACLDRVERLEKYDEYTAIAAEVATLFGAVIKTTDPATMQADYEGGAEQNPRANPAGPRIADMQPGMMHFLSNVDNVTALDPKYPTTNFRDYVLYHVMLIGAELGLPLVATLFDASQLSWSNIKALLNLSMRSIEPCQARLMRLVRWVRAWKVREWMEAGYLKPVDNYERCSIVFPAAPVVDFRSEVEGYATARNNRWITNEQIIQRLGTGTFESVSQTLAAEEAELKSLGIAPVNTPGAKTSAQTSGETADASASGQTQ